MADLTPRTRSESFLNGEDLEPITRREHFYAGRENELPEGHQEPETREEWFIQKYREAGDVTVESLSITENGTYTAPSGKAYSPVSVNVPLPSNAYLLQTKEHESIATFADGTDNFVKSLEVAIEPQQDLHGYDAPWVGGAGKNKLPMTVDLIKSLNTSGIWSGNSYTLNNVVFTIMTDENDNVTGFNVNGIANATMVFICGSGLLPPNTYIGSGCPSGGSNSTYRLQFSVSGVSGSYIDTGSGAQFTSDAITTCNIFIANGFNAQNMKFYPMIRLSSESDATFAPYSNICPISGWSAVDVTRCGKNLWGGEKLADDIVAKVPNATKDTINKTVTYTSTDIKDVILFDKFKQNTQYSFLLSTDSIYTNIAIIYTDGTWQPTISNQICVSDASKTVARLVGIQSLGTTDLKYDECGVFEGVITVQDFEPYNEQVYTIDLDGTRYGGKLDVVSGVLTMDEIFGEFDGVDESWTNIGAGSVGNRSNVLLNAFPSTDIDADFVAICNTYIGRSYNDRTFNTSNVVWANPNGSLTVVTDSDIDTAEKFKTLLQNTPLQVIVKLATPITIQLTPTIIKSLQGDNNFFASTGEIELLQYWGEVS